MYHYDLSIILPGIRNQFWVQVYEQIKESCKNYSYEVIFSGPRSLPPELENCKNVKHIKHYGHPSRAVHLASLVADGEFMTWLTDDALIEPDAIDGALSLLKSVNHSVDIVAVRYTEGVNHGGGVEVEDYYRCGHHQLYRPLHLIDPNWKTPIVMMVNTDYYKSVGGLDCRYVHINMNVHDLAFRMQRNGSVVYLSPTIVMRCDWDVEWAKDPLRAAYYDDDMVLFKEMYSANELGPIVIDENWQDSEPVWSKRFKV